MHSKQRFQNLGGNLTIRDMHSITKPVRDCIKPKYPAFDSMDGNAQFYEIFQSQVIADFSLCEKEHLISQTGYM